MSYVRSLSLACVPLASVLTIGALHAQSGAPPRSIQSMHVQGNVWVIAGAGGNITVQVSASQAAGPGAGQGVLLVDTGDAATTEAVRAEMQRISPGRIEYILNTSAAADHVGGNAVFAQPRMDFLWTPAMVTGAGVRVLAHENVLPVVSTASAGRVPLPVVAWPTNTFSTAPRKISFNDEPIVISHQPAAVTDGDSIVFFRKSDVISTGDIFQTTTYPAIDPARGGTVVGIIRALNEVLDLMVPRYNQEGGTLVVPGHGRIADQHDVLEYRDMLAIVSDRIRDGVARGLTLAQIKAIRPTLDYDARWAAPTGLASTDGFVDAIYAEMVRAR